MQIQMQMMQMQGQQMQMQGQPTQGTPMQGQPMMMQQPAGYAQPPPQQQAYPPVDKTNAMWEDNLSSLNSNFTWINLILSV